jgi:hypothetical protein
MGRGRMGNQHSRNIWAKAVQLHYGPVNPVSSESYAFQWTRFMSNSKRNGQHPPVQTAVVLVLDSPLSVLVTPEYTHTYTWNHHVPLLHMDSTRWKWMLHCYNATTTPA